DRLATLGRLMREHGDLSGIVFNRRTGRLIGGHQRKQHLPPDAEVHVTERLTKPNAQGTVAVGYVVADGERWAYREVDVDEQREAAMNVAANKGGMLAEFDVPKLADLLSTLDAEGYDATLTGFDAQELEDLLTWAPDGGKAEDPDIDLTPPAEPKSKRGEVYELGRHRVMCGDATSAEDVGRLLNGATPLLMVTDPPYGVDYDPEGRVKAAEARGDVRGREERRGRGAARERCDAGAHGDCPAVRRGLRPGVARQSGGGGAPPVRRAANGAGGERQPRGVGRGVAAVRRGRR